jgi:hypothetical protein
MVETLRALLFGNEHRPHPGIAAPHQRRHLAPRYRELALRQRA